MRQASDPHQGIKTVKTVDSGSVVANTQLKQGVNEMVEGGKI